MSLVMLSSVLWNLLLLSCLKHSLTYQSPSRTIMPEPWSADLMTVSVSAK